jgi:hypothetical protein
MTTYRPHSAPWQLAGGLVFIGVGLLLLFDRLSIFSFEDAFRLFWPLALIALGITRLLSRRPITKVSAGQDNGQSSSL